MNNADRRKMATPTELAAYLDIPIKTLEDWRHRRVGPPWLRVGKHVRYPWPGVDRWIVDRQVGAA